MTTVPYYSCAAQNVTEKTMLWLCQMVSAVGAGIKQDLLTYKIIYPMILSRFCSKAEFDKYMAGETIVNNIDHGAQRGYDVSTAIGFCFFIGNPEEEKHRLSGIVDFDVCITVDVSFTEVHLCHGRYPFRVNGRVVGVMDFMEFCTRTYNNRDFKLIEADTSFSDYCPGPAELREILPDLGF